MMLSSDICVCASSLVRGSDLPANVGIVLIDLFPGYY